jgi:hypothetical protein
MLRVIEWNGRDIPQALRDLPPGRYVLEDETPNAELAGLRELAAREIDFFVTREPDEPEDKRR